MNAVPLAGCRNDSLLGYLKGLGTLRLLATQADPAVRASWNDATIVLHTALSREAVDSFFIERYAPTPILNPWNGGAGFDGRADAASEALGRVGATVSIRWAPYRKVLTFVNDEYIVSGRRAGFLAAKQRDGKQAFVRDFRARCPEEALPWLDAAIVLGAEGLGFPFLFGSGGNDGRLDFSVNFAARALDVVGETPVKHAPALLADALDDTATAPLVPGVAIGQFSARHAGGANATSGFDADSLVNPWDYLLMLEGALMFSGAVGRRLEHHNGAPLFPFAFRNVAGGYATASSEEESRGELWLPIWRGSAAYVSVADLLRKGRADLPSDGSTPSVRAAVAASEGAAAVLTLGTALGLDRFERIGFVQRNGLAFTAATIGRLVPGEDSDPGIAVISRVVGRWVDRVSRAISGEAAREALRTFNERLFAFAAGARTNRARERQGIFIALARLEYALARTGGNDRAPMPYVPGEILATMDDGSAMHRIASSVASLGAKDPTTRTRLDLEHVSLEERKLVYSASRPSLLCTRPAETLLALFDRRLHSDPKLGWLEATQFANVADIVEALTWDYERMRCFQDLLCAYSLIDMSKSSEVIGEGSAADTQASPGVPVAYALLKLVMDHPKARTDRIPRLLAAKRAHDALTLAMRRARTISELLGEIKPHQIRDVSDVQIPDSQVDWFAAALAIPIADAQREILVRAVLPTYRKDN